jgi:hypothetical protein
MNDNYLLSILEIVGAHFVDVFYNHIYSSAHTALSQSTRTRISVTDEYRRRVQAYTLGIKQDQQCYRDIITNLHTYFQSMTRYSTLSFADFIDRIVSQFVPNEYFQLMRSSDKDETMGTIICNFIAGLGAYVTGSEMLPRIIDGRAEYSQVTIRMLQDHSITLLLAERDELHNLFIRKQSQAKNMISMDVVETLKQDIHRLEKQTTKDEKYINELETRIVDFEQNLKILRERWKNKKIMYKTLINMLKMSTANDEKVTEPIIVQHEEEIPPE